MASQKIGVFVCRCGGNISDYVDVEKVVESIKDVEGVKIARVNMFSCSDSAQEEMIGLIKREGLDGIVIASCSPKLHLNTFRQMAQRAGLNPYQYTQVNIREQCSWTHTHDRDGATKKAARLVRAGIEATRHSEPLHPIEVVTRPSVLVVGAGIGGLRAAIALGEMGLTVHLVEKEDRPGGLVGTRKALFPTGADGTSEIDSLLKRIHTLQNISLYTNACLVKKEGSIGDFSVSIRVEPKDGQDKADTIKLNVGAILVTTGATPYVPKEGEYGYGTKGIVTLREFLDLLDSSRDSDGIYYEGKRVRRITYIYCVGSRQKEGNTYCSRFCCSSAIFASLEVHKRSPDILQYHLYRDIRTYGSLEALYQRALDQGSLFIRFSPDSPPKVECGHNGGGIKVLVKDLLTSKRELEISSDLVVLVTGLVPRVEQQEIQDVLKLPVGKDGFFNEIHPKLRPVETVVSGIYIGGCAQGPKNAQESVESSLGAAAKAGSILLKGKVELEPFVAEVDEGLCDGCGQCVEACPYDAITMGQRSDGTPVAVVNTRLCKGEGACVPVCPKEALEIKGYGHEKIRSMIRGLLTE